MESIVTNSQAAVRFLQLVVSGQIDEAYETFAADGKHHNPYSAAGFPSLMKAMKENHAQFPNKSLSIKHVLVDGDFVAVHSHLVMSEGSDGIVVVHLFRFSGKRIVEMWDCGQAIPDSSLNADGAF